MKDKRKLVFIAVLAVLAVILIITKLMSSGPAKNSPAPVRAADKKADKTGMLKTAIKVDLDLLRKPKEGYLASKNIFNPVYEAPSLSKLAGKAGKKGLGKTVTVTALKPLPPPPPPKSQAEIDADNAREEMKKFKVMGFLKRKGRTDVFLSLGQENYVVAKGDNITKQYYLTSVAKDSLTVSDKKTGIAIKLNTDFSKDASSKIFPSPGYGGTGKGDGALRHAPDGMGPGPSGGRPSGPLNRNYGPPGNAQRLGGMIYALPGNAQGPLPDPLNNFSTR